MDCLRNSQTIKRETKQLLTNRTNPITKTKSWIWSWPGVFSRLGPVLAYPVSGRSPEKADRTAKKQQSLIWKYWMEQWAYKVFVLENDRWMRIGSAVLVGCYSCQGKLLSLLLLILRNQSCCCCCCCSYWCCGSCCRSCHCCCCRCCCYFCYCCCLLPLLLAPCCCCCCLLLAPAAAAAAVVAAAAAVAVAVAIAVAAVAVAVAITVGSVHNY